MVGTIDGQEPVADDVRPMIVLCLEGEIRVSAGKAEETLTAGESVFVEDTDGVARVAGAGRFAIARTPA